VSLSRTVVAMIAVLVLAHCGRSSTSETTRRRQSLDTGDARAPCYGPACSGLPMETLRLAPPAFPVIPSQPLGPTDPLAPGSSQPGPGKQRFGTVAAAPAPPPPGCSSYSVDMRVLVISTDGSEPDLKAIQQTLGYHAVPYSTWIATQKAGQLTADKLASGCAGKYQGVILTTGALAYSPDGGATWQSALSPGEWQALWSYEASFHVREISWYVFPGADQGLNPPTSGVDTGKTPIQATLTAAGKTLFPYVNASNPIPITGVWAYLATAADSNVTPLLVDGSGHALASSRVTADGRETMALTFDGNPNLVHHGIFAHGLVEWVTKGVYLGEFRAYLTPHVDDIFIDNDMYFGGVYRMTAADFDAAHAWQTRQQSRTGNSGFRLTLAFNGEGGVPGDPLTQTAIDANFDFHWINHTFNHDNLDAASYDMAFDQIDMNIAFAMEQGLGNFFAQNLVTPDVSGLKNPDALAAAFDLGVRYVVSDTSQPGYDNPAPNIGIYSADQPEILFIPRRPTNLFYSVSTPQEWAAQYNALYTSFWGRALTYAEILDKESEKLLIYVLNGEVDPQMYHQSNLRAYDGVRTLLGDLHDVTLEKFRRHSTLPVRSPQMHVAGSIMEDTMERSAVGLTATLQPGASVTLTNPSRSDFVWVTVSGVCTSDSESYAGKCIAEVFVPAGGTVTLPLQ
jgi:hypothetical protein